MLRQKICWLVFIYPECPISFETVLRKPSKKIKQIFLFKVIAINCHTLVGAIFQVMHCSQKISNRNSLQFRHYRCLNVAYGCISVLLQLHFQLRKCKIVGGLKSGEYAGMVKSFAWATGCSHCSAVNTCGTNRAHSFHFFKSSDRMRWTMVFGIPILSTIIPQVARRLSFKNAFTNIFHIFAIVNPALQQNCIVARCSKFFSMVIYNTSTEYPILYNTLIQPHMDGSTSNLVCRWRRV